MSAPPWRPSSLTRPELPIERGCSPSAWDSGDGSPRAGRSGQAVKRRHGCRSATLKDLRATFSARLLRVAAASCSSGRSTSPTSRRDLHKSFEGLASIVRGALRKDPDPGHPQNDVSYGQLDAVLIDLSSPWP